MTDPTEPAPPRPRHVCPVWVGHLLASPVRRLFENPTAILGPYVTPGSIVVDVGCAMGFHSLELARLVGDRGRVVSVDIQQKMLDGLRKRARRKGLDHRIETRLCSENELGLDDLAGRAELVTVFNVVHETPDRKRFLAECAEAVRTGGRLLLSEPQHHVSERDFDLEVAAVLDLGLSLEPAPVIRRRLTRLFRRAGV
jgi:ubiquinone/menaquinone biosynthesis C-methylase UbiE